MTDGKRCGRPLLARDQKQFAERCVLHEANRHSYPDADEEFVKEIGRTFAKAEGAAVLDLTAVYLTKNLGFSGTTFQQNVVFDRAHVANQDFSNAKFLKGASFHDARLDNVDFYSSEFGRAISFKGATFSNAARFSRTTFLQDVTFESAIFHDTANFGGVHFRGDVDFRSAVFRQTVSFINTQFEGIATFQATQFKVPADVRFYQVNHGAVGFRARFLNTNVEKIEFRDVNWFRSEQRLVLQDEIDIRPDLGGSSTEPRHELVAALYRQLINNFERERAFDLAEDCFLGAMEMKRLDRRNPLLQRYLLRIYNFASHYGSSYRQALGVLFLFLALFAFVFSFIGIEPTESVNDFVFERVSRAGLSENAWFNVSRAYLNGWIHSAEIATFQRRPRFAAVGAIGYVATIVETVLIPAQVALLLLALRRRFKR
jgi:hypothetical protein